MRSHRGLVFLIGCVALASPSAHSTADEAPRLVVTERSPEDRAIDDALGYANLLVTLARIAAEQRQAATT